MSTANKKTRATHDFDKTMTEITSVMPLRKRAFSRVIHAKPISAASNFTATTLLRPNALLFGAIASFACTLVVYLFSKNLGYSLSGSESIVSFLIGWTIGLLFDIVTSFFKRT